MIKKYQKRGLQKGFGTHCGVSTTMGKVLIAEYYFFPWKNLALETDK